MYFGAVFQCAQGENIRKNFVAVLQPVIHQLHAAVDAVAHGIAVNEQQVGGFGQALCLLQLGLEGDAELGVVGHVILQQIQDLLMTVGVQICRGNAVKEQEGG